MLMKRSDFSFHAWCYLSKKLNIFDGPLMKNVKSKWLRNWNVGLIIVFVATPGGGYPPVQKLFTVKAYMSRI